MPLAVRTSAVDWLRLTGSLRALLSNLIDYAGLYPPAGLPLDEVIARYKSYRDAEEHWILNRLVLPATKLPQVQLEDGWRITLLTDAEPGPLPPQVETLETRASLSLQGGACLSLPCYSEGPLDQVTGTFAKLRTGGLVPDAIPSSQHVAEFLHAAAARRLPFKATAGLHHPVRADYALTYAADSPRALMHGFLNVFIAAVFAWQESPAFLLTEILEERDPRAFEFRDHELLWRGRAITTSQVKAARLEFAHSFGSCSFEEPVAGLRDLGLLT